MNVAPKFGLKTNNLIVSKYSKFPAGGELQIREGNSETRRASSS